jgi:hypothetical protein
MIYKKKKFNPNWKYEGKGGDNQICKIYAYTCTHKELRTIFGDSAYMLNELDKPFSFGHTLLKSHATGQVLDLYKKEMVLAGNVVKYNENTKESAQGMYYECSLEIEPDSDSMAKWLQEVNSHQRPTIFVIVYSQGGGRVIGNLNSGANYGSKYDAGGKKRAQERIVKYIWDSHHPSFYIEDTNELITAGYIRAKDINNAYYSDVLSGEDYFTDKFSTIPYEFVYNSGSLYFRLAAGSKITGSFFTGLDHIEFEDPNGFITEINGVTNCLNANTVSPKLSIVKMQDIVIKDSDGILNNLKNINLKAVTIDGVVNNVVNNIDLFSIKSLVVNGELKSSFSAIDIGYVTYFPLISKEYSIIRDSFIGNAMGLASFFAIETMTILGNIINSFNTSKYYFGQIDFEDGVSGTSGIDISFSNNSYFRVLRSTRLFGGAILNSFDSNQAVDLNTIDTKNIPGGFGNLSGYFDNTNNLRIRNKIGSTIGFDAVAGLYGFKNCTGVFEFKVGYDTINGGFQEGDVRDIILQGSPSIVLYNQ